MKIRTAIFGVYVVASAVGLAGLMWFVLREVRPRHVASLRSTMEDAARLIAGTLADGRWAEARDLGRGLEGGGGLRMQVWDGAGELLFDSGETGRVETSETVGMAKRAVTRAMDYEPYDSNRAIMVEAPIPGVGGEEAGRVRLSRPLRSVNVVIWAERKKLAAVAALVAGTMLVLGWVLANRLTAALERLADYARAVRDGREARPPPSRAREIAALGEAFESMRRELEGKAYVERYTQALTHEIKSPLAGVRGAVEILQENPPAEERARFLGHLRAETDRMARIVDRMLELTALESRSEPQSREEVTVARLVRDQVDALRVVAETRGLEWDLQMAAGEATVRGDRFLLGQAVSNLLQNAVDFSPVGGRVRVELAVERDGVAIVVADEGPGVPDYALGRVFERFYSLPRPESGRKSTGLGLSLVREIARLHGGAVSLANGARGGARAELRLPRAG